MGHREEELIVGIYPYITAWFGVQGRRFVNEKDLLGTVAESLSQTRPWTF
jgi:hypothetical protein